MHLLRTGEVFPRPNPMPGQDFTLADFSTGFFDIQAFLSDPSPEEINTWRKSSIEYGIYSNSAVPFFIIAFMDAGWNIDVNVNVLNIRDPAVMEAWLNAEGNIINLYLVNTHNHVLEGMRTISIIKTEAERLRDILEEQSGTYADAKEVELKIAGIQHTISTVEMIKLCKMIRL